jgi:CubicO group peptidase (beta-lactamase class C family)
MTNNLIFKSLIAAVLLVSTSVLAEHNNNNAPVATVAETEGSFRDLPKLKKAFFDTAPADRKDGLAVGKLAANGADKAMILQLAHEIADQKHGEYNSMLISHKNKLVFESYYLRGRVNLAHFQASATKGYTTLLVGRAIQLGYLTMADLNKPLTSFLKGLDPAKFVDGVEKITLHQAMTMRSGLRFSEEQMKEFREDREQFSGIAQVQSFLELSKPITLKSQVFKYRGTDPIMVMQVIDAVVPGSAKDFIKNELFDKLEINNYKWRDDHSGLPIGDSGSNITSRDMLKLGSLLGNKGRWNGKQLISEVFLAKATSNITKAAADWHPDSFNYGYYFYQTNIEFSGKSYDTNIVWGGGGQHIVIVEELDLVITITGWDMEDTIFTQVAERVIPAFVK